MTHISEAAADRIPHQIFRFWKIRNNVFEDDDKLSSVLSFKVISLSVRPSVCAPLHLFHLWNVLIKPNPPHLPNDGLTNWMTDWMRTTCLLSPWINKHLNSLNICRKYLDFVCLEWKWQIFYEATRPAYNPSVCLSIPLCQHPLQWNNSDNDKPNKKDCQPTRGCFPPWQSDRRLDRRQARNSRSVRARQQLQWQ